MNFLNPWLWLGLLGLGAPLWLHLQRRSQREAIRFSAMQFLDEEPIVRRAPLHLRDLWLLLLRVLAVACIAAAFAWPYYQKHSSGPRVTVSRVYILDNTLSQQVDSQFGRDRDAIVARMRQADDATQEAVIELSGRTRAVVNFGEDRKGALDKLRALQPSFQRGSYLSAFRQANGLLQRALGTRKEIVFYGDGQENQWGENLNVAPFIGDAELIVARQPTSASRANSAVNTPVVRRLFLGDRSMTEFSCQFAHSGAAGETTLVVRSNGQEILRRSVDPLKQPETFRIAGQWNSNPAEWVRGEVALEGAEDALPADDIVYFAAPPVREGKVAVLARSPFLRGALSPEVARGHWAAIEANPAAPDTGGAADADVLAIEANYLQSAAARALVSRYLDAGKGVFLMVDRLTPIVQDSLARLGYEVSARPGAAPSAEGERLRSIAADHPIFQPFLSPDFGNLNGVRVLRHERILAKGATPLLFGESGDALLYESVRGKGKLLLAAFSFDRAQTNWGIEGSFVPFLDLCLQWLRPAPDTVANLDPGDLWVVKPPVDRTVKSVTLRDGKGVALSRAPMDALAGAQLNAPGLPGIYNLCYDEGADAQQVLVVNVPEKESRLVYQTGEPGAKTAWLLPRDAPLTALAAAARKSAPAEDPAASLAGIFNQRLWWLLVLCALGAMGLELGILVWKKETASS